MAFEKWKEKKQKAMISKANTENIIYPHNLIKLKVKEK